MVTDFATRGRALFGRDPAVLDWLTRAGPAAIRAMRCSGADPAGFDCEGTWFVGLDALPNDATGAVNGSGPLTGRAVTFLRAYTGGALPPLHRAQVSALFPGYPRPRAGEGEAAFRYRQRRDAAHVDGLLPVGPDRRRMIREPHAFVLGLPVTACDDRASPMVVWDGSHRIMGAAFRRALAPFPPEDRPGVDLTEAYQAARREVFRTCRRVKLVAQPGGAYVLHRHALHGIAPWEDGAEAPPDGRVILYFRPECPGGIEGWLEAA